MLSILRQIVLQFSHTSELNDALACMVKQIKKALQTDCCSIYLADYQQKNFVLMASDGLAQTSLGQTRIGFSEGLVGLVGKREEPLNIANAKNHQQYKYAPEVQEDDFNAFLGTPIIHQRKVIGILSIQQKKSRFFTENDEAFLVTLSAQLAGALANAEIKSLLNSSDFTPQDLAQLQGIAGAPGIASGVIFVCQPLANLAAVALKKSTNEADELLRFQQAVAKTREEFEQLSAKLRDLIDTDTLAIFEVYKQLLDQASLRQEISLKIKQGWCADSALKLVIEYYIKQFEAIDDSYLRERASDIRDLGTRLLVNIQPQEKESLSLPEQFILLATDVTASMLAQYQHQGLQGVISLSGSNNSHAAIIARSLGLPAIMGVNSAVLSQLHQQHAIIDGYTGQLFINPSDLFKQEYQYLINQDKALTDKVMQAVMLPCITRDGRAIELQLNAGLSATFEHSFQYGALGIGLYRTEIPFMSQQGFPSEQQQTSIYRQVLEAFPKHSVTMRTLDIGGDKSLPYFPITENNPALGWRGIRITLDHPEIFLVQIRAMFRANQGLNNLEIMLPMISSIEEVDAAILLINRAFLELTSEIRLEMNTQSVRTQSANIQSVNTNLIKKNQDFSLMRPKIGIMLEVPSVIFQMEALAKRVDFFSVGSNDLTQYLLAVDRNNSQVANLYDAFHPAVLSALNSIAQQAARHLIPISLCGELASQPAGAILLLAMGYDKLSMNGHNVPRIKWVIRHITLEQAQLILMQVLSLDTTKQVHDYLNEQLESLGLGSFIRAGY